MNQKQESPFGNPKFLMALAITFFGLWGWQYYLSKKYPQPTTNTQQDNSVKIEKTATIPTQVASATSVAEVHQVEEKFISYQDDKVKFEVTTKGMGVKNYTLKKYTDRKGAQIVFESAQGQAELLHNEKEINFNVEKQGESIFVGTAIVDGRKLTRTLSFNKETESFLSELEFDQGLENISLKLFQKHHKPESTSFLTPSFEHQDFIWIEAGSTKSESIAGLKDNEGFLKTAPAATLASIGTQYFTAASVNKSDIVPSVSNKVENNVATVSVNYNLKDSKISKLSQDIYLGPKETNTLKKIDKQLLETLNYGMFGFISSALMSMMVFLYGIFGNWGLAIIALTLVVRAVLLPFNVMSFRSAQAMQKVKPKLDAIRERFKDDPMRMNKETMAVMKENNANPLSGCLPMLIQIPIFFALWRAIGSSIEIYQQPFFGWITDLSYHDPFFVFPILMGITMYLQQKMTPTTMDATQAKIMNFMPILFTLFMLTLPSGLTLYNFVSALFGVVQQYFLLKETKNNSPVVA